MLEAPNKFFLIGRRPGEKFGQSFKGRRGAGGLRGRWGVSDPPRPPPPKGDAELLSKTLPPPPPHRRGIWYGTGLGEVQDTLATLAPGDDGTERRRRNLVGPPTVPPDDGAVVGGAFTWMSPCCGGAPKWRPALHALSVR